VNAPLYPLLFQPYLRPMPWGGTRLRHWLQADFPSDARIGEAWLISDHAQHTSVVANGTLAGTTLRQLMVQRCEELIGFGTKRFPLLIKLLDASENLSIQVHPDDELARRYAPDEGGKTEAWYVLAAEEQAAIYLGLKPGIDRQGARASMEKGTLPECMVRYRPRPGECYFVPAGAVHALGGGTVVLEVQQTSDATFRLFDWGRIGPDGRPRKLHKIEGMACIKDGLSQAGPCIPLANEDSALKFVECPYFQFAVYRGPDTASLPGPHVVVALAEDVAVSGMRLRRGQAALLPAGRVHLLELGDGQEAAIVQIKKP
jgi:mannose-6-phosphate isomerase